MRFVHILPLLKGESDDAVLGPRHEKVRGALLGVHIQIFQDIAAQIAAAGQSAGSHASWTGAADGLDKDGDAMARKLMRFCTKNQEPALFDRSICDGERRSTNVVMRDRSIFGLLEALSDMGREGANEATLEGYEREPLANGPPIG
jgi:hypothetical protein